jgi:hypothetical protein
MMTDLYYGAQFPLEIINKGDTQDDPPSKTSSVDISGEGNWLITQRTKAEWVNYQSAKMVSIL